MGDSPLGEDPVVRAAALEALGNWNGSVVVVDPNTGRILSIVNQKLALSGAFTPCSTFKPVVALAALKEGIVSPETKLRVWGRGCPRLNLTDALAHSNNMYFAKLGEIAKEPGALRVMVKIIRQAFLFARGEEITIDHIVAAKRDRDGADGSANA